MKVNEKIGVGLMLLAIRIEQLSLFEELGSILFMVGILYFFFLNGIEGIIKGRNKE